MVLPALLPLSLFFFMPKLTFPSDNELYYHELGAFLLLYLQEDFNIALSIPKYYSSTSPSFICFPWNVHVMEKENWEEKGHCRAWDVRCASIPCFISSTSLCTALGIHSRGHIIISICVLCFGCETCSRSYQKIRRTTSCFISLA